MGLIIHIRCVCHVLRRLLMPELHRVDLLLPQTLLKRIKKEAKVRHTTFSSLVRESLQRTFRGTFSQSSRLDSVRQLQAMSLPVGSWKQMESEINKGRTA
jgi:hypothetical protein